MRTLKERLAELRQIDNPTPEDFTRLWQLAEDMDDEIDRLRDLVVDECSRSAFWQTVRRLQ